MLRKIFFVGLVFSLSACSPEESSREPSKAVLINNTSITANQIVDQIKKEVNCPWRKETVDTFKEGNPDQKVTGIATTFLANMDVLKKAKAQGANFIITHEPTYYNHRDKTEDFTEDQVYLDKKKFIEENNLIIWRFHDHWHYTQPDGIHRGMVEDLGWGKRQTKPDELIFEFPETTVKALATQLQTHYKTNAIRVVGDPNMTSTKVGLVVGSPGSMAQIEMLRKPTVEVLIIGEVNEWETVEYVRDAIGQGKKMALILVGHANSEEAGMVYCKEWLADFIKDVPIMHIPAGDPFWTPN